MIVKGKVLTIVALLFLASSLTVANASSPRTPFYLRAHPTYMSVEWMHQADDQLVIAKIIEQGYAEGDLLGNWTMDIMQVMRAKGRATVAGHLVIYFNSGETIETIEGTVTAKIPDWTSQPPDVDGVFVGHGAMNVKCDLYVVMEGTASVIVLEGYSW
jgi:hypothetical protein